MNLFRSEEHLRAWLLYSQAAGDFVMPVADWAEVFGASMFRERLAPDFLSHSDDYLSDYRTALRARGKTLAPDRVLTTIMFSDIVDSTKRAALAGDSVWRSQLEQHNLTVRDSLEHFGGKEIKQTGDGFLATFESPARAIQCGLRICASLREISLEARVGIHSGEVEVFGADVGGIAVHIGARIGAAAGGSEVFVSRSVKDAVTGSDIAFQERGEHDLKGVPGQWQLYRVIPQARP